MTCSPAPAAWRLVLGAALALAVALSPGTARSAPTGDAARDPHVAILMYHVLGDPPAGAPFPDLYVRTTDFVAQLRWLGRHGYHPVTLRRVWEHWRRGSPLPSKPVVVSFDDGHRSTAEVALPRLRERGWPGVLNLKTLSLARAWGLRPRQVRLLIAAGWEIDAHSITHPDLTAVGDRQLVAEVAGSRGEIRRRFGVPANFFCYPSGRFDGRVIAAVRRAGFLGATTTLDGLADPNELFTLRRVRMGRSDGVSGLAAHLARLSQP
ncbi:MAG: polysaccharide deacetylase family protein [Gaiellaceae bacterium]